MTADDFYKLVLALWGEDWRPRLLALLAKHGHHFTRQTLWNWRKGKTPVPDAVAVILNNEAKRKGIRLWKPFDNYEISPCRRFEEPGEPGLFYFEVCEPHDAHVWTLYGHIPGEGVMAIGDFASREETEETFQRITGIPFGTHEEVESRLRVMHAGARLLVACDNVQRAHVGDGITMAEAVDACLLAIAEAAGTRPIHPSADPLEALQLASAYIQYVKVRNPELHVEADGSPSVEAAIAEAIGRAA